MEDDCDLHAVVSSCSSNTAAVVTAVSFSAATAIAGSRNLSNFVQDYNFSDSWFEDPFEPRRSSLVEDLDELWKPFFPKQQILPISPLSGLKDLSSYQQQQEAFSQKKKKKKQQQEAKQLPQQKQQLFSLINYSKPSATSNHPTPRSKKRKNHSKKVCQVAAENLSSDQWSWRKYGQKPIKGSPYPRGYYKCSTSKGCMARKQVERNRSDPGMFIVTYTGEHSHPMPTHRTSLAGSTRQKPSSSDDSKKPSSSPPPPESSREDFEEDEDEDFFAGLEDFTVDCVLESEHLEFPWLGNNGTTAATAVGGG